MIDIMLLVVSGLALIMLIGCWIFEKAITHAMTKRGYVKGR